MKKKLIITCVAAGAGILTGSAMYKRINKKIKNLEEEQTLKTNTNEDLVERIEKLERNDVINTEAVQIQFLYLIATILILAKVAKKFNKACSVFDPILEPGKKYSVDEFIELLRENETYMIR